MFRSITSSMDDMLYETVERSTVYNSLIMLTFASSGCFIGHQLNIYILIGKQYMEQVYQIEAYNQGLYLENLYLLMGIGAVLGSLFTPFIVNGIGKINTLILNIYWVIQFEEKTIFIITILCVGFIIGISSMTSNLYMVEIQPKRLKKGCGLVYWSGVMLFLLINIILNEFLTNELFSMAWRIAFVLPVIVTLPRFFLLLYFHDHELPCLFGAVLKSHQSANNDSKKIDQVLGKFYGNYESIYIMKRFYSQSIAQNLDNTKPSFKNLCNAKNRQALFSGILVNITQQFTGFQWFLNFLVPYFNKLIKNGYYVGKAINIIFVFINLIMCLAFYCCCSKKLNKMKAIKYGVMAQSLCMFQQCGLISESFLELDYIYFLVTIYSGFFSIGIGGSCLSYCCSILDIFGLGVSYSINWLCFILIWKFQPFTLFYYSGLTLFLVTAGIGTIQFALMDCVLIDCDKKYEENVISTGAVYNDPVQIMIHNHKKSGKKKWKEDIESSNYRAGPSLDYRRRAEMDKGFVNKDWRGYLGTGDLDEEKMNFLKKNKRDFLD